jgi:hypothetical protein
MGGRLADGWGPVEFPPVAAGATMSFWLRTSDGAEWIEINGGGGARCVLSRREGGQGPLRKTHGRVGEPKKNQTGHAMGPVTSAGERSGRDRSGRVVVDGRPADRGERASERGGWMMKLKRRKRTKVRMAKGRTEMVSGGLEWSRSEEQSDPATAAQVGSGRDWGTQVGGSVGYQSLVVVSRLLIAKFIARYVLAMRGIDRRGQGS